MIGQLLDSRTRIILQKSLNFILVVIGLTADLTALGSYFSIIHTPTTGSNFYVNGSEFLAWVLIAVVYSAGFINAVFRRRWRRLYGTSMADHSVFNVFYFFLFLEIVSGPKEKKIAEVKLRNFKRDFSIIYVFMFIFVFLFSRAVTATENATSPTGSPWGDLVSALGITLLVTLAMMVVTTMFDFTMSIFIGDDNPENL